MVITVPPENATVLHGTKHTFHCEAKATTQGAKVKISWQKYEQRLQQRDRNYKIHSSGNLRFTRVTLGDTAYYRCVAEIDGQPKSKVMSEYAFLQVQGMFKFLCG